MIAYAMGKAQTYFASIDGMMGMRIKMIDPREYQKLHPDEIDWLCIDETHPTAAAGDLVADMMGDTLEQYDMRR